MERKSVKFKNIPPSVKCKKKSLDMSQSLPPKLYDRVAKIFPLPFSRDDDPFEEKKILNFRQLLQEMHPELLQKLGDNLNEDNFVSAIEQYRKAKSVEIKIDPRVTEKNLFGGNYNWTSDYFNKMKRERTIWNTKLFKDDREIHEKPLFEQTEALTDVAAEQFAMWLKQMDDESSIDKDFVKKLFSIQVEGDALKSLLVEPKEISVVPHEAAKKLQMPNVSNF